MSDAGEKTPIGVLISGTGSNLQALFHAIDQDPDFGGSVVVVGSDRRDAAGLLAAHERDVPTFAHELGDYASRDGWEEAMVASLQQHDPQVIVLAGFMRLVSATFLTHWPNAVVNTHPSLLPAFKGAHAIDDALAYGAKVTGATVHFVDEHLDHGPIIAQQAVAIYDGDDHDTVRHRIQAVEHKLLPACVGMLCRNELSVDGRLVHRTKD